MEANIFFIAHLTPDIEVPGLTRALLDMRSSDYRGAERRTRGTVMIPHQRLVRARGARSRCYPDHTHFIQRQHAVAVPTTNRYLPVMAD